MSLRVEGECPTPFARGDHDGKRPVSEREEICTLTRVAKAGRKVSPRLGRAAIRTIAVTKSKLSNACLLAPAAYGASRHVSLKRSRLKRKACAHTIFSSWKVACLASEIRSVARAFRDKFWHTALDVPSGAGNPPGSSSQVHAGAADRTTCCRTSEMLYTTAW